MMVDGGLWVLAVMWCPGLAGMALQLIERRSLRELGWGWGRTRYQAISYALPLAYAGTAYAVIWITGLGQFPNVDGVAPTLQRFGIDTTMGGLPVAAIAFGLVALLIPFNLISAAGEEIGWRGYLVPQLSSAFGPTKASFIAGSVWALWHFPAIFLLEYHGGTLAWYSALMFFVMVIGISFALTWLRLASGSLWTGAILHASHNGFIQAYFDRITGDTGSTAWFIGEFGAALALTGALTGYLVWRATMRERNLPAPTPGITA
jgi:membrane protease YdiL (CAAX protease family)